jgi:SpoIID/LytB domain protein
MINFRVSVCKSYRQLICGSGVLCWLIGLSVGANPATEVSGVDRELKIGVVQRFGTHPADTLTLKAMGGDRLTLQFMTKGQPETLTTESLKLEIKPQALTPPILDERLVLSTHRSFESAEDSAEHWRAQGIEVEMGQPERWQVWAKREVYNTPLLRRLLLHSIEAQGKTDAHLETQILAQKPIVSWVVGNYRYSRDALNITARQNPIQVVRSLPERQENLYAGTLQLQPNAYGTYTLVNQVPLETYLRGVVPHEIGTQAPPAAIEAQAILARTYALRNLRRFQIDNYELCADTQCQVYEGLTGTYAPADQAIAATQGQVLTYNRELIDALYFSTSGGVTAAFSDVWNGPNRPYLKPVVDSVRPAWNLSRQSLTSEAAFRQFIGQRQGFNEAGWPTFRWQVESSLGAMTKELKLYLQKNKKPLANFTLIRQVEVTKRSASGRVQELTVTTDVGKVTLVKDEVIQALEAPYSLLFYLKPAYKPNKTLKSYTFIGGGLGHGVGLSQVGSYNLGRLGWSYRQILSFYYPGTQLQPLNPSITFWRSPASPVLQ